MNTFEIEDFIEDVQENQYITLVLHDGTEKRGFLRKIRKSNIKIEYIDKNTHLMFAINFSDIRRYEFNPNILPVAPPNPHLTEDVHTPVQHEQLKIISETSPEKSPPSKNDVILFYNDFYQEL